MPTCEKCWSDAYIYYHRVDCRMMIMCAPMLTSREDTGNKGRKNKMEMPLHLHEQAGDIVMSEMTAALRRSKWVVILNLKPFMDGNMYCFLWGENLQDGVAGFGKSVEDAINDFEKNMITQEGVWKDEEKKERALIAK